MSSRYYEVESVQETKFEPDQHGNRWYSVKFAGIADSCLWLAKNRPESGGKVFGFVERTKSGKGWRFRRQQVPEDYVEPEKPADKLYVAQGAKEMVESIKNIPYDPKTQLDRIEAKLDRLLGEEPEKPATPEPDKVHEVNEEEPISLEDIPF